MNALYWAIRNFIESPREEGQTMAEYALILALIAVVVIVALNVLGPAIRDKFNDVATGIGT